MGRAARKRAPARLKAVMPPRAKAGPFPGFVEPCLATSRKAPPTDERFIHEIKFDGYRTQAQLRDKEPRMLTRRGHDWTKRFAPIAEGLTALPASDLILDGEVIVQDESGVPDFARLHADLARGRKDRLIYYAFDLLYLDGFDLRPAALLERKRLLAELLADAPAPIFLSEHFETYGPALFERACAMRLEGVVSKRRDDPYRSGASEGWIKSKCVQRDSFPIVAFVEKLGAKPRRIASLYLGRREGNRVLYAGKAQSGYTLEVAQDVREKLDPYITRRSPLAVPVKKPKATWVEPVVEAEVEYSSTTADGLLRAPVFKGLREDLMPLEAAVPERKPSGRGFTQANILQLLPDAVVPSKDELVRYWRKVGKRALEHLGHRPLKLVRHVSGTTFYHKGPLPPVPDSVHQLKIEKREGGEGVRLWVDDIEGLIGLTEIGAVELHPWNATIDDLEHADRMVIDLDPGEGIAYEHVVETALGLRALLEQEGLQSWPKVTGGKGLHLMVPLERRLGHDVVRSRCRALLQRFAATARERYTLSSAPGARPGRIFLDYLRNGRGNTAVGAWSPRARPGLPIARPVTWSEVEKGIAPDAFSITSPGAPTAARQSAGRPRTPRGGTRLPDGGTRTAPARPTR